MILLHKVQKGQRISPEECTRVKAAKLVEGRYPNLMVAGRVAAVAGRKAQHVRNRGFDGQYYRDMVVALVREHPPVSREDIERLLLDKLPEVLTQAHKLNRIHNSFANSPSVESSPTAAADGGPSGSWHRFRRADGC